MFLPGTVAAATKNRFSSVTGRSRSRKAASAMARVSGAPSSGSPSYGSRPSCTAAAATTSGSGGSGGRPKYPSTERPYPGSIFAQRPCSTFENACSQYCWLPGVTLVQAPPAFTTTGNSDSTSP